MQCHSPRIGIAPEKVSNAVKLKFKLRLENPETTEVRQNEDSFVIYYSQNYTILQKPFRKVDLISSQNGNMTVFTDSGATIHDFYKYFVFKNGEVTGSLYGTDSLLEKANLSRDSMYKAFIPRPEVLIEEGIDSLISTRKNGSKVTETYIATKLPDLSYSDTTLVFYDTQFPATSFSFASAFESKKKMKVTGVHYIFKAAYDNRKRLLEQKRDLQFSIENLPLKTDSFLNRLVNGK